MYEAMKILWPPPKGGGQKGLRVEIHQFSSKQNKIRRKKERKKMREN